MTQSGLSDPCGNRIVPTPSAAEMLGAFTPPVPRQCYRVRLAIGIGNNNDV